MTLKNMLTHLLAKFAPLALTKNINPVRNIAPVFTQINQQDNKSWLKVNDIEFTQDDFA